MVGWVGARVLMDVTIMFYPIHWHQHRGTCSHTLSVCVHFLTLASTQRHMHTHIHTCLFVHIIFRVSHCRRAAFHWD